MLKAKKAGASKAAKVKGKRGASPVVRDGGKVVKIAEAKANLSRYVKLAREGRRIVICDRNTPVAELGPIAPNPGRDDEERAWIERLVRSGVMSPPRELTPEMLAELEKPPLRPRKGPGMPTSQIVIEERRSGW